RHNRSKTIVDAMWLWFEARLPLVAGRRTLAEAIRYALSRWQGLTRFLHDGRIELDTNPGERPRVLRARLAKMRTLPLLPAEGENASISCCSGRDRSWYPGCFSRGRRTQAQPPL